MLDWFAERWNDFIDFSYRIIMTFFDLLKDLFFWGIDSVLGFVISIIDGMSYLFSTIDVVSLINGLPPETKQVLALTGISEAMSMVVACILIRVFLQLIPFVRLGS